MSPIPKFRNLKLRLQEQSSLDNNSNGAPTTKSSAVNITLTNLKNTDRLRILKAAKD